VFRRWFDLGGVVGQDVGVPETPSIVELLERLVALEKVVAARDARIEALERTGPGRLVAGTGPEQRLIP